MQRVRIFDFDETLLVNPEFYEQHYMFAINNFLQRTLSKTDFKYLKKLRRKLGPFIGYFLSSHGISFETLANCIENVPLDLIQEDLELVELVQFSNGIHNIIYSGNSRKAIERFLLKMGFPEGVFNQIIAYEKGFAPKKWSRDPTVFQDILGRFNCRPESAIAIGNSWEMDLEPLHLLGGKTALIAKKKSGNPDYHFQDIKQCLIFLNRTL